MELQEHGRAEDAIDHYTDMLRLNPNDNQGVREILAEALFDMRRDDALFALLERYDDRSPAMAYTWTLTEFRRGATAPRCAASLRSRGVATSTFLHTCWAASEPARNRPCPATRR